MPLNMLTPYFAESWPPVEGATVWLRADSISGLTNGDPLTSWTNEGSLGGTITRASGDAAYYTNVINGLPAIRVTSGYLESPAYTNFSDIIGLENGTTYLVFKQFGYQLRNTFVYISIATNNSNRIFLGNWSDIIYYDHGSTSRRVTVNQPSGWDDTYHYLEYYRDGTATDGVEINVDGVVLETGTMGAAPPPTDSASTKVFIFTGSFQNFEGELAELVIFKTKLSISDRVAMLGYLSSKYGFGSVPTVLEDAKGAAINGVGNDGFRNAAGGWTSGADNKLLTFSAWFKCSTTNNMLYLDGNNQTGDFRIRAARYWNVAVVWAFNSSASEVLQVRCSSGLVNDTKLHHILVTADLSNSSNRKMWVDGVVDTGASWITYSNQNIDWVHNRDQKMLDGWNGSDNFQGSIAEMWFTNEYIGTADDNVNKFYYNGLPVDLGSDGSTPTGTAPIAYYALRDGDVISDWGTNKGSGPDFTVVGTPTISTLWD